MTDAAKSVARFATAAALILASNSSGAREPSRQEARGGYAEVNGLKMYFEIHGTGRPLVLLHGAFGTIEGWGPMLKTLAKTRQVIAVELQGHGRTADVARPLNYETMADDVAALMERLQIRTTDVFGYSMGGAVALALAIRHPDDVGKVAVIGACTRSLREGYEPEAFRMFMSITPESFNFPQVKDPYVKMAPDPKNWPVLVSKVATLGRDFKGFSDVQVKSIKARTLIMMGDRDGVRPEHAVEMHRLISGSQLAIFPGADHFLVSTDPNKVLATLEPFLEAPTESKPGGAR